MVKTIRQIGNSYGIIIERPILDLLDIDPNTQLSVTTEGGALVLRPIRTRAEHKKRVREASARVGKIHEKSLKDLAD